MDLNNVLKMVNGLDVFQSGEKGQQTSVFTRGSESNHTLVLLNGVAINDQSVTDGLHDFGQDFINTLQQVDIYKGSSGVHFIIRNKASFICCASIIVRFSFSSVYSWFKFNFIT